MCKKCFFIDAASQRCVFYYTAVANMNKVNLPITEMFTVRHSATSIGRWLSQFTFALKSVTSKWPKKVVIDQSDAFLNACCISFNAKSVEAYLDEAYTQIKDNESSKIKTFIIHCKSHVLKSFKQKMPSHPKIKRFFLNALKMMMSFKIYANFLFALESFFWLL